MKIKVLNKKGLAACIVATSEDKTRGHINCVLIEPSGRCVGIDGQRMVVSNKCVESFEGEPLLLTIDKLTAQQTNSDSECIIFIDGDESRLSFTGAKRSMTPVKVYDNSDDTRCFPDYESVQAHPCGKLNAVKFQTSLLHDVEKILNHGRPVAGVRFSQAGDEASPICVEFESCTDTQMTLMPMRQS